MARQPCVWDAEGDTVSHEDGAGNPKPYTTLEATQGQILSQPPTDATSSR